MSWPLVTGHSPWEGLGRTAFVTLFEMSFRSAVSYGICLLLIPCECDVNVNVNIDTISYKMSLTHAYVVKHMGSG